MGKKRSRKSLFSTFVQQINEHETGLSSSEYHLIDNEYFAAFGTLDDIQQFHNKISKKQQEQPTATDEDTDSHGHDDQSDIDMKSFAERYLIDLPEHITKLADNQNQSSTSSQDIFALTQSINWSPKIKSTTTRITQSPANKKRKSNTPMKRTLDTTNKRIRRNIQRFSQSNQSIYMSDNDNQNDLNLSDNIFESLQNDSNSNQISLNNVNSILSTLNNKHRADETTMSVISDKGAIIKSEPIEPNQLAFAIRTEPVESNVISSSSMNFNTSMYSGDLDHFVQNIHHFRPSSNVEATSSTISSRPKRIRKQKKRYIEESKIIARPKKMKIPIRKKRPLSIRPSTLTLTDAEIEQQFGERLPTIKSEQIDDTQEAVNSQLVMENEPVSDVNLAPIEKARAQLLAALGRGHDPDTYSLKIRSREHQVIEVQLAIYGTADWHPHRAKILAKIEEALRGLRVSWTKIDIHVDHFDIQISTSSQLSKIPPPTNTNSSWFLKALSESGPVIVHVHDRRHPQQRFLVKCSCPECLPISIKDPIDSSLPVIVNVYPAKTPPRRLVTPTILNKTSQKYIFLLHNIDTSFFNELIRQYGRATVISVTQCVLDLSLITSVHASLPSLCVSPNYSKDEYKKKYQQIIDPLKCTFNENENNQLSIARAVSLNAMNLKQSIIVSKSLDILHFYNSIKQAKTNLRNSNEMRDLINKSFSTTLPSSASIVPAQLNVLKGRTLILPKSTSSLSLSNSPTKMTLVEFKKIHKQNRRSSQTNHFDKASRIEFDTNETKQQANCTSFIELRPIMSGPTMSKQTNEANQIQNINRDSTLLSANKARVIRLSIAKSTQSNNDKQDDVISPRNNSNTSPSHSNVSLSKGELVPLIPKQINIIKPLSSSSSSITPAIKLSNPILITHKSPQASTK